MSASSAGGVATMPYPFLTPSHVGLGPAVVAMSRLAAMTIALGMILAGGQRVRRAIYGSRP
jgi:hypothetical protein